MAKDVRWAVGALLAVLLPLLLLLRESSHGAHRRHAKRAPVHRDVDAHTSGQLLEQQASCAYTAPPLTIPQSVGQLQPFIVVHESHVGEQWLTRVLQARSGVKVIVGQERAGRAKEAMHEWLSAVMDAARAHRSGHPVASANASRAVGLLLTARAARSLNITGRLTAAAAARRVSALPAVAVLTLARRNRLKHALSRYVRSRPSLSKRGGGARGGIAVQPASLLKLLDVTRSSFTEVLCAGAALATALRPPGTAPQSHPATAPARAPHGAAPTPLQRRALLALHYEDLLYSHGKSTAAIWRHLRLDAAGDAAAAAAGFAAAPVAKSIPNSLCRALSNYEELCTAVRAAAAAHPTAAGPWVADLGVSSRSPGGCGCPPPPLGLVLGGSHHKTGTLLLERVMQAFGGEVGLHFEKPHWDRCGAIQRKEEAGICFDEHATVPKLQRFLRSAVAFVHIVREPLEVCVSSYQYHLRSTEGWLRSPRQELNGKSWQQALRGASTRDGLLLECRRSLRDQIRQQGEVFNATRRHPRVLTLRMEELETAFDASAGRLFRSLLASAPPNTSAALLPALLAVASRFDAKRHHGELDDGHLSPKQRKRELRAVLLNDTAMAAQLASWRALTGYDASFAEHCRRYGFSYYAESMALLSGSGTSRA